MSSLATAECSFSEENLRLKHTVNLQCLYQVLAPLKKAQKKITRQFTQICVILTGNPNFTADLSKTLVILKSLKKSQKIPNHKRDCHIHDAACMSRSRIHLRWLFVLPQLKRKHIHSEKKTTKSQVHFNPSMTWKYFAGSDVLAQEFAPSGAACVDSGCGSYRGEVFDNCCQQWHLLRRTEAANAFTGNVHFNRRKKTSARIKLDGSPLHGDEHVQFHTAALQLSGSPITRMCSADPSSGMKLELWAPHKLWRILAHRD